MDQIFDFAREKPATMHVPNRLSYVPPLASDPLFDPEQQLHLTAVEEHVLAMTMPEKILVSSNDRLIAFDPEGYFTSSGDPVGADHQSPTAAPFDSLAPGRFSLARAATPSSSLVGQPAFVTATQFVELQNRVQVLESGLRRRDFLLWSTVGVYLLFKFVRLLFERGGNSFT